MIELVSNADLEGKIDHFFRLLEWNKPQQQHCDNNAEVSNGNSMRTDKKIR